MGTNTFGRSGLAQSDLDVSGDWFSTDKGQDRKDQEHDKENLSDPARCSGYSAKAQNRCDDRDDKEDDSIVEHLPFPPTS